MSRFEWMVALRYLRARRKQTVISVITAISIVGVAAGVMALIIALAVNNGFQSTLQADLLSATGDVTILSRDADMGIDNWAQLVPKLKQIPGVLAATPGLYGQVALKGPLVSAGAVLKGVPLGNGASVPPLLRHLQSGSLAAFSNREHRYNIILGAGLADTLGLRAGSNVSVIGSQLTPMGIAPALFRFHVAGIFDAGLYDINSAWAFTTIDDAQNVLGLNDVVNAIELRLSNVFAAPEIARQAEKISGPKLIAQTWMHRNRALFNALKLEKRISVITVGLIELVAALNILVVLVMLVMEKHRDIAILMSMGARRAQVERIFVLQGLIIGGVGCILGLTAGYSVSALFNHYHWLRLDQQIYALSYVPFQANWTDGFWVAALALFTSFIASLHPSRTAARIAPAEAL
ncbi:MAG: FtsX-like permease family protein, partial [Bryobacteraceae bacterium]